MWINWNKIVYETVREFNRFIAYLDHPCIWPDKIMGDGVKNFYLHNSAY